MSTIVRVYERKTACVVRKEMLKRTQVDACAEAYLKLIFDLTEMVVNMVVLRLERQIIGYYSDTLEWRESRKIDIISLKYIF